MLIGKGRKIAFFLVIYLVFGLILIYLINFNIGLELAKETDELGTRVFLRNSSMHLIRNVDVVNENGIEIASFEELPPGEERILSLRGKSASTLTANAPFHFSVEMPLAEGSGSVGGIDPNASLNYTTQYFDEVYLEEEFPVILNVCAFGGDVSGVEIVPEFEEEKVEFLGEGISLDLAKNSCQEASFSFKALAEGQTQITFNIDALNSITEANVNITILGVE